MSDAIDLLNRHLKETCKSLAMWKSDDAEKYSEAELSCATCKHEETMPLYICCDCVNYAKHELAT